MAGDLPISQTRRVAPLWVWSEQTRLVRRCQKRIKNVKVYVSIKADAMISTYRPGEEKLKILNWKAKEDGLFSPDNIKYRVKLSIHTVINNSCLVHGVVDILL